MTLKTAIERLEAWGCKVEPPDEVNRVMVWDPDGNWLRIEDGAQWVIGVARGLWENDPTRMVDILDMACEGTDDFDESIRQMEEEIMRQMEEPEHEGS